MITSSDREYKATKHIKQAKKLLQPPYNELARWIESKWNVTVLNVIYDHANSLHAPWLQVILRHERHARKFHNGVNFDQDKQSAIANRFLHPGKLSNIVNFI